MGVEAHEPRVVNMLLDFMYGYVSGVLSDAAAYAEQVRGWNVCPVAAHTATGAAAGWNTRKETCCMCSFGGTGDMLQVSLLPSAAAKRGQCSYPALGLVRVGVDTP
jgi:hypothetical protein